MSGNNLCNEKFKLIGNLIHKNHQKDYKSIKDLFERRKKSL